MGVTVAQIMCNVCIREQTVVTADTAVYQLSHFTMELNIWHVTQRFQLLTAQRIAYLEVYPALVLNYSGKDAVKVLTRFLYVRFTVTGFIQYQSLKYVT